MRANQSFGAKWNEDENQHLKFKKLPQTSENQTPSWLLLQTSITKQKYQVANFNRQPTKAPRGSLYWPMPWHVKESCGGRSRRVNRAKNIPRTLNPQPTQPPTNSTNDPHLWSTFAAQKPNPVSAWLLHSKDPSFWISGNVHLFCRFSGLFIIRYLRLFLSPLKSLSGFHFLLFITVDFLWKIRLMAGNNTGLSPGGLD